MPPGPHRRKPAKRKKKPKLDRLSTSSTAPHPHHGESDGSQHKSPQPLVKVEDTKGNLSGNESSTTERTQKDGIKDRIEINKQPVSTKKHEKIRVSIGRKKAAMIEPATVADYLSQPFESSPEKGSPKVDDLGFMTPPFLDPVDPVDQSLVEVACELHNYTNIQEKDDLEHTDINETDPKEILIQKLCSSSEKASPKSRNNLLEDSTNSKCRYSGRQGDDRVNEAEKLELSEIKPLIASDLESSKKTSWKSCCGIFKLFLGSFRN